MNAQQLKEEALRLFIDEGFSCSEATALAAATVWGLDTSCLPKMATGLAGGIGHKSSACGALTGGALALGLKYGRMSAQDTLAKDKTLELVGRYYDQFQVELGSTICQQLCGCDLSTPAGRQKFKDDKVKFNLCQKIVGRAAEILARVAS